jgi:hypothetical protein
MSRSRSQTSFRRIALMAAIMASPIFAAPIQYTVEFTVGPFSMGTDPLGLAGSQFTLNYLWDASTLVPVFDVPFGGAGRVTVWPNTNTTASVTIAGSTSADGTFSATPSGGKYTSGTGNGDTLLLPEF